MSTPTPIITVPPKTKPGTQRVSLAPQGVQKVSTVLKQYSTWVLGVIIVLPDAFQAAVAYGIISVSGGDDPVSRVAQLVAAVGLALKFIKQQKPE